MIYHITHVISGRNRSFDAKDWREVEDQLVKLGLDPDDWMISSITEIPSVPSTGLGTN